MLIGWDSRSCNKSLGKVNYIGFKIVAESYYNYKALQTPSEYFEMVQFSELKIENNQTHEQYNVWQNASRAKQVWCGKNGIFYTSWLNKNDMHTSSGTINNAFDNNVYTKFCDAWYYVFRYQNSNIIVDVIDANGILHTNIDTYFMKDQYEITFSSLDVRHLPCVVLFDISQNPMDIDVYNSWSWYTANDAYRPKSGRQWIYGEVLVSSDDKNWFMIDKYFNLDLGTSSPYQLAYQNTFSKPVKRELTKNLYYPDSDYDN